MQKIFWRFFLLCLLAQPVGCATVADNESVAQKNTSLTMHLNHALMEKLASNLDAMVSISKDMRQISEGHLFYGSDEQLNIIQKSSLYILLSTMTARHQKDFLSIIAYIRSDRQKDFATELVKGLKQAVFDSAYHLNALNTYYAFIENETARENIDNSVKLIRANMDLYKQFIVDLNDYFSSN